MDRYVAKVGWHAIGVACWTGPGRFAVEMGSKWGRFYAGLGSVFRTVLVRPAAKVARPTDVMASGSGASVFFAPRPARRVSALAQSGWRGANGNILSLDSLG